MTEEEKNDRIRKNMQFEFYERGARDMYHLSGKAVAEMFKEWEGKDNALATQLALSVIMENINHSLMYLLLKTENNGNNQEGGEQDLRSGEESDETGRRDSASREQPAAYSGNIPEL